MHVILWPSPQRVTVGTPGAAAAMFGISIICFSHASRIVDSTQQLAMKPPSAIVSIPCAFCIRARACVHCSRRGFSQRPIYIYIATSLPAGRARDQTQHAPNQHAARRNSGARDQNSTRQNSKPARGTRRAAQHDAPWTRDQATAPHHAPLSRPRDQNSTAARQQTARRTQEEEDAP